MDRDTALKLLGLDASATPEEVESAYRRLAAVLDERISGAASEALRFEYRTSRDDIERAIAAARTPRMDDLGPRASQPKGRQPPARPSSGNAKADSQASDDRLRLPEGRVLASRFELRRRVGLGGQGAVFVAFDRERDTEVALKVFLSGLLENGHVRERLLSEAELAHDLSHSGIARVFDVGRDGELHFIAMELLEGRTLRQEVDAMLARGRRFSVAEVVHVGRALCDSLGHAHQHMVHGGIKPENVFLCDDGSVKVTDFGIDRLFEVSPSTTIGVSVRTVSYMAPEQLRGSKDIDDRADQYSTAAVLYEMLTGDAPVGRVKSLKEREPDVPRLLSDALDRALASNPADRFPNMGAFGEALARRGVSRAGRMWWRVAAVVVLLLVAATATFPRWGDSAGSIIRSAMRDPEAQASAEAARTQALASASAWHRMADLVAEQPAPDEIARADDAFSAGERHFEAMDYGKAEASFRQALELYEAQVAAGTLLLRDEPSAVARVAKDLFERMGALERELYTRAADAAIRVEGCEKNLRNARSEEERTDTEMRRRAATDELELINRLKTLTHANVFGQSLRAKIANKLSHGDRQLEEGRHRDALTTYATCKAQLEELLAWPGQAESALREQAALSGEVERLRSVLGPVTLQLEGVQSAFDGASAQLAQGNEELTEGRVPEAVALFESAREHLSHVRVQAAEGLLLKARAYGDEGKPTAAALALDELLALDPNHTAGRQLWSKLLSYRVTNAIGMDLVFIPPGDFTMGSPSNESGHDEDEGQRLVKLTSGFYMATTEVTQSQWSAVMEDNPSRWEGDDLPVEQISWEEALEFCRRLSDREGRPYRLPTEEEWEYACRAGTTTPFSFGDTISTDQANYDGNYVYESGTKGVFRNETVPVGTFPPNAWGLYDMHGNVWEWCPDSRTDYPPSPVVRSAEDAPILGRVLRSGSWRSRPRYCRCANRVRDTEGSRLSNIGFRVVLESD